MSLDPGYLAACDRASANLRDQLDTFVDLARDMLTNADSEQVTLRLGQRIINGCNTADDLARVLGAAAVRIAQQHTGGAE